MVENGTFREDLYYRLQEFVVELPPLRRRQEDISLLAMYFMHRMAAHLDKEEVTELTSEALSMLESYDWPGNVRELEHAVRRAVIVCSGSSIRAEDIALGTAKSEEDVEKEPIPPEEYERWYVRRALDKTGWVIKGPRGAAALLGIAPSTLHDRMRKLRIERR
jgi:transcriptional regulator with GAF, ATPase, and Fis domain